MEIYPLPSRIGALIVVSGPSGVGKDTVLQGLYARTEGVIQSVSATTRERRIAEENGVDYHFLTPQQFEDDVTSGRFLEYARYGKDMYGTPREPVERWRNQGLDVTLKIEVVGAFQVKEREPNARLLFIAPPSLEELERRLRARGTENEERIAQRLLRAEEEMACIDKYDYILVNDQVETAVRELRSIVIAERHRVVPK